MNLLGPTKPTFAALVSPLGLLKIGLVLAAANGAAMLAVLLLGRLY